MGRWLWTVLYLFTAVFYGTPRTSANIPSPYPPAAVTTVRAVTAKTAETSPKPQTDLAASGDCPTDIYPVQSRAIQFVLAKQGLTHLGDFHADSARLPSIGANVGRLTRILSCFGGYLYPSPRAGAMPSLPRGPPFSL